MTVPSRLGLVHIWSVATLSALQEFSVDAGDRDLGHHMSKKCPNSRLLKACHHHSSAGQCPYGAEYVNCHPSGPDLPRTLSCTSCCHSCWCQEEVDIANQPLQRCSAISWQCGEWDPQLIGWSGELREMQRVIRVYPRYWQPPLSMLASTCSLMWRPCWTSSVSFPSLHVHHRALTAHWSLWRTDSARLCGMRDWLVVCQFARRQPRKLDLMNIMLRDVPSLISECTIQCIYLIVKVHEDVKWMLIVINTFTVAYCFCIGQ